MRRFSEEVLRRRVPQTIGAYLVAVISILTAADLVLPGLPVSEDWYRYLVIFFVAMFPVVVLLSWFYDITRHGIIKSAAFTGFGQEPQQVSGSSNQPRAGEVVILKSQHVNSVAVLPFVNSSTDAEGEYLSDGITETIINKLASLSDVRVIPRASAFRYKNSEMPPLEICRELKVQSSVTGSVNHFSDQLIVQAELVDAENESQLWGGRYNAQWQNLFDLQEEIATKISQSLKPELSRGEQESLQHRETEHLDAYQEYLRGRFLWNKRTPEDLNRSIIHFNAALEKDPLYAVAYSGLADAHNILGYYSVKSPSETYPLAKSADKKALEIDHDLAEAHASLGYATLFYDRDWDDSCRHFTRAIELKPEYGTAHQWYAWYLMVMERFDEALASFQKAADLDPLAQIINDHLSYGYMLTGQMDEARKQIERTQSLYPNYPLAFWRLGDWHLENGSYPEAAEAYSAAEKLRDGRYTLGYLGLTYGLMGDEDSARNVLKRLDGYEAERYVSPLDRAFVYAGLGDTDKAFEFIDKARDIRVSDMVRFKLLPWPEKVKSDPRFDATVQALNLPS